jgi:hypothetical protein
MTVQVYNFNSDTASLKIFGNFESFATH